MKRAMLFAAVLLLLFQSVALAQERDPLAMRVEFEWSVRGIVLGAVIGAMLWLTDPANPNNVFSSNVAGGAAWGALLGAGMGFYVLQRAAQFPAGTAYLPDSRSPPRLNVEVADPAQGAGGGLAALPRAPGRSLIVPLFKLRF